jgi:hypothetical protein
MGHLADFVNNVGILIHYVDAVGACGLLWGVGLYGGGDALPVGKAAFPAGG